MLDHNEFVKGFDWVLKKFKNCKVNEYLKCAVSNYQDRLIKRYIEIDKDISLTELQKIKYQSYIEGCLKACLYVCKIEIDGDVGYAIF